MKYSTKYAKASLPLAPLSSFAIDDKIGFLRRVHKPYVDEKSAAVYDFVEHLPLHLKNPHVREKIEALPTLEITEANALYNHSVLSFLAQAYMLGANPNDPDDRRSYLPENIAVPLNHAAKALGVLPGMTYLPFVLTHKDVAASFSGGVGEAHFVRIHMAIETAGAVAVNALHYVLSENPLSGKKEALQTMGNAIAAMGELMTKMPSKLEKEDFLTGFRRYLIGSEVLPEGLEFKGVDIPNVKMAGSSGMQSPLLPVLDAFFGVKHEHPGIQKLLSAAHETYMPAHKWFIEEVAQRSPAMLAQLSHLGLNKYICEAIGGLVAFRQAHIDTVSHYIGSSVGTGGSSGTSMLQVMLDTTQKQRDVLFTPTKVLSCL